MNDPPDLTAGPGPELGPDVGYCVTIPFNENNNMDLEYDKETHKGRKRPKKDYIQTNFTENIPTVVPSSHLESSISLPQMPDQPLSRTQYISSDRYPYVVHVQRILSSPNDGSSLHPLIFGKFLQRNNIQNIVAGSIKRIGRNRCTVGFATPQDANNFVNNPSLESCKLKAIIPSYNVTRIGIVKGIPTEWSLEEIIENVTVPIGFGKIIKVRRINYKVKMNDSVIWKPTQSVVITFDGQILPSRIFVCYNALPVDLYIFPTLQCYQCCRYGHTKAVCRSRPRCFKCGQEHLGDSCSVEDDDVTCILCSGRHCATNKICPEFNRQKLIKVTMAEKNISYAEASRLHPQVSSFQKSYSDVLNSSSTVQTSSFNKSGVNSQINSSYKKTVFLKPRSAPKLSKGYDKEAHNSLIKENQFPSYENGCALQAPSNNTTCNIMEVLSSLIDALQQNNILRPSNVAMLSKMINNNINNGFQHNSVEL